nr:hypothetical protein [uncultured Mucilaginibacter sp.]
MRRIFLLLLISCASCSVSAQIGKWTAGCYYLSDSSKVCGSIKWNVPTRNIFKGDGDHIQYRVADTAEKIKVSTKELRGFVIKADSFVVSHNPELADYPVLLVRLNSPLKLYLNLRENNMGTPGFGSGLTLSVGYYTAYDKRYFYGTNPNGITQISRKNFKEVMSRVLSDTEYFVKMIKDELYRYGDMEELLKAYEAAKLRAAK